MSGPDAHDFLQNIVTNDLDRLRSDRALYAALLTPQGTYLHDFLITKLDDAILIESERERHSDLVRKLILYRLRSKATIEVDDDLAVGVGIGPQAQQAVHLEPAPGAARPHAGGVMYADPRSLVLGVRACLPRNVLADTFNNYGFAQSETDAYERVRLQAGIPDGVKDLVVGRSYLLESNFDLLDGVSFSKGCYIGQENTARQRYRGTIRRRLAHVVIVSGPAPAAGTPIRFGERDVGTMRSSSGQFGLAQLRLGPAQEALATDAELICGDATLRISGPIPEPPSSS